MKMPIETSHNVGGWISDAVTCVSAYLATASRGGDHQSRRQSDKNPGISKILIAIVVHVIITAMTVAGGVTVAVWTLQNEMTNVKDDVNEIKGDIRELRGIHLRRGERLPQDKDGRRIP